MMRVHTAALGTQIMLLRTDLTTLGMHLVPQSTPPAVTQSPRTGLWTSTYNPLLDRADNATDSAARWLLTPDPTARVYTIDQASDLDALAQRWTMPVARRTTGGPYYDMLALAACYDALHLTAGGPWLAHCPHPLSQYGWDDDCTLWIRWAFVHRARLDTRPALPTRRPRLL